MRKVKPFSDTSDFNKPDSFHVRKRTDRKKFLKGCGIMALAGLVLGISGVAMGGVVTGVRLDRHGFQVSSPALQGSGWETETEKILEPFDSIEISLNLSQIRIETWDSPEYAITYCADKEQGFQYEVNGRKLVVTGKGSSYSGNEFSLFSFGYHFMDQGKDLKAVVYLPEDAQLDTVSVTSGTADIFCQNAQTGNINISSGAGDVTIQDVQAGTIQLSLDAGSVALERTTAANGTVKCAFGNVAMSGVTLAEDLEVDMNSGHLSMKNTSMRDFVLDHAYGGFTGGGITVRNAKAYMSAGDCELADVSFQNWEMKQKFGDVKLQLADPSSGYEYDLDADFGDITLNGKDMGNNYRTPSGQKGGLIKIESSAGDIELEE